MNRRYDQDAWLRAHDLVVRDGATYAEAAEATGIGLSAMQKKGRDQQWLAEQRQHQETAEEYRRSIFRLKLSAAKKAMDDGDPQAVHALTALERAFPEYRYRPDDTGLDPRVKRELVVQAVEAVVGYLEREAPSVLHVLRPYLRPMTAEVFSALGVAE